MPTKKQIIDDFMMIANKFVPTDDSRLSERWASYKIDHIRAQLIMADYKESERVDFNWVSPPFYIYPYLINAADDPTIFYSNSEMSKCELPQIITLTNIHNTNQDVGIVSLTTACGKFSYYPRFLNLISSIPSEHPRSKFKYYARNNTTLYVTGRVDKLRLTPILLYPEDGFITNSAPIASGALVSGTKYIVKFGSVVYNSTTYYGDDPTKNTFVANATATFTGSGKVYLYSQVEAFEETDPYPIGGDMARMIILELLTKEFALEEQQLTDYYNDSVDDVRKAAKKE